MNFLHLFKLSYYFDNYSSATFTGFWVVVGLTAAALIASLVMKRKSAAMIYVKRTITERITAPVFVVSWIMLLWLFFRYEGIVYLSWRLWPLILFIYLVVAGVKLWRWYKIELPKKKAKGQVNNETKLHYLRRFQGGK